MRLFFNILLHYLTIPTTFFIVFLSCEGNFAPLNIGGMAVRLQNQNEHSGIMVRVVELDTFVITNPIGNFELKELPDGDYTLEAKYPYFASAEQKVSVINGKITTKIQIELNQQLQFWIEPAETTISINNLSDSVYFSITGFRQYRVNITEDPVIVGTYLEPLNLWALIPQGFDWPYIPNIDSISDLCYLRYGWLGGTDAIIDVFFTFLPGDKSYTPTIGSPNILKECFQTGNYLFFSCVSDLGHFPEYFDPSCIRNLDTPNQEIYDEMNRSLIKKVGLFRPAILHVVD